MDTKIITQGYGFATYPSVKLMGYKKDPKTNKLKFGFLNELLFGDYIKLYLKNGNYIEENIGKGKYIKVIARKKPGYVLTTEIQTDRILEVNFIDVAQGDGCHVVTPDDEHFIIDAGEGDNMFRFLSWRFNLKTAKLAPPKFTAIISHSDKDHYGGFDKLFTWQKDAKNQFSFKKIYHNGLMEESGKTVDTLGNITGPVGQEFITDLCDTNGDFTNRQASVNKQGDYIKMLCKTDAPKESLRHGCAPIYNKGNVKIEVMGPIAQKIQGKDALPIFLSDKGKTKNGHSIILKLSIGKLRLLLGGDLNSEAEEYLFKCFTGVEIGKLVAVLNNPKVKEQEKKTAQIELDLAIKTMREQFEVDIAKSCHHGSPDFTNEFLLAINPIATIISSGDEEPYCHPRPDTLGTIGKFSRGKRSLIFSTELARSTKEFIDLSAFTAGKTKERAVTVYGMINVRADGEKVIIAQKLEKPAANKSWDIHKLEWNNSQSEFEYVSSK
jgi:beta-lactamase superfamily II metal-dependent hydrolase